MCARVNSEELIQGGVKQLAAVSRMARTVMRRIPTFRSTTDSIYDDGPILLQ